MFKNIAGFFSRRQKAIKDEVILRSKISEILTAFVKDEILKKTNIEYSLSYTINNGILKVNTDNKLIAQEIALRITSLEKKFKNSGLNFKKLLI